MSISRITNLAGFDNIIVGRDLAQILENGAVYSITEVMGEIMIKKIGESAIKDVREYRGQSYPQIMSEGRYLLTKEEYQKQLENDL